MNRCLCAPLLLALAAALGCASAPPDGGATSPAGTDAGATPAADPTEVPSGIPRDTIPPDHPDLWPLSVRSERYPVIVHYRLPEEEQTAREIVGYVEEAWRFNVDELGFRPPLDDRGGCGPDGAFDVYVWRDRVQCWVDTRAENPETPWNDWTSYMILDPWGKYGGDELPITVTHELNHACQAVDDWHESGMTFEMTASFVEELFKRAYVKDIHEDFQGHPDWSFDHFDDYETWYMYGSALYLQFLRDRYYGGSPRFVADLWYRCRNPPGAADDQALNEPDFEDALDDMLHERAGISFLDSMREFARWRWYLGAHDDGHHFHPVAGDAAFPETAVLAVAARVRAQPGREAVDPAPMMLGSSYVEVFREAGDPDRVTIALEPPAQPGMRWVVQAVPGIRLGQDGEVLDLSWGRATLSFGTARERTLILTALPTGPDDPDTRTDESFPVTLVIER